jgi:acetyl esterase/lipase
MIHGGCWTKSTARLSIMNQAADDLRKRGAAVWNIEYRGVDEPGGGYPGTYQDVADALDRVGAFAEEAELKLDRVVVVGHSAGGHLALWAAAHGAIASGPLAVRRGLPVAAVVDIAGIPDLATDTETACGVEPVDKMAGPARLGGRYADTSPAHMVPLHVRQLVVVGAEDTTVPPAVSEAYVRRARDAGDRVDFRILPDAAHAEEIAPGTPGWDKIAPLIMELAR